MLWYCSVFFAFVCHISILRGVFYILLLSVMLFFIRHIRITLLGLCCIVGGVLLTQISRDTMSLDGLFWDVHAAGFSCRTAANINVPESDCNNLVALYSNAGGSNRTTKTNRSTDTDVCTWYGVGCTNLTGQDRVTSLSLPNNNIVTNVAYALQVLASIPLTYLDLSYNQFDVQIPDTWSSLTTLTGLDISHNELYGELPSSWSSLTNLTSLDLSFNKLYGSFPGAWAAVGSMPNHGIPYIDISNNCISISPTTLPATLVRLNANATTTPYNLCLVYVFDANQASLSGERVQILNSGDNGTPVEIQARPWYNFFQWSDSSTDNPRTDLAVTSTRIITAVMSSSYTLSYSAWSPLHAVISGSTTQFVSPGDNGTPVEALPLVSGYDFLRRSDGSTDNPRRETAVASNLSVTAIWRASCATMANIDVPLAECEALVDLYLATDGDSWTTNTNRYTDSNICTWYGVSCSLFGFQKKVTSITLPNNNLVGTLPSSLSWLTELTYFAVNNNSLIGSIPSSVISNRQNIWTPYIIASYNCLQTLYTPGEQVFLNLNASLSPQNVCNDTSITQSVVSLWPISLWSAIRYMISYANNGPDIATGAMIKLYPWSWLSIQSGSISYTEIRTGVNYMTFADSCFSQMMTATTGLYVDDLNAYAVTLWGPDMKTLLQNTAWYTWDDNRWAFFLAWWDANNPTNPFRSWYFSYMLWVLYGSNDIASIHPTCGDAWTFDHYRFSLGDLPSGATWSFTIDALVTGIVVWQTWVTNLMTIESTTWTDYNTGNNISSLTTSFGYSVSYLTWTGGSISGTALQTVTLWSDASTVTAIPDSAYSFSWWSDGYTGATRTDTNIVADNTFTAYFTLTPVVVPTPSLWWGGGWGGGWLQADVCPTGDRSSSYYDGSCGIATTSSLWSGSTLVTDTQAPREQTHTSPLVQTIERCASVRSLSRQTECFIRQIGWASLKRLTRAMNDVVITRWILASVISEFAITVMHQTPDTQKKCLFTDTRNRAMRQVCQLHLMGIEQDHTPLTLFASDELVTKQQFVTVIGRMVYGGHGDVDSYATRLFADKIISSKRLTWWVTKDFILRTLYKIAKQQ